MPETVSSSYCTYNRLENGIHEFILGDSSRVSFDALLDHISQVYGKTSPEEIILNLVDFRKSGLPPLRYGFQRTQESIARFKKEGREIPRARSAYLHNPGAMIMMVQSFLNLLNSNAVGRFFAADEREKAIEWLLEGTKTARE